MCPLKDGLRCSGQFGNDSFCRCTRILGFRMERCDLSYARSDAILTSLTAPALARAGGRKPLIPLTAEAPPRSAVPASASPSRGVLGTPYRTTPLFSNSKEAPREMTLPCPEVIA